MKVHDDIRLLGSKTPFIITIGNFDGIHLGHRFLFQKMVSYARQRNYKSLVISFKKHTKKDLLKEKKLIYSPEMKILRLKELGIDYLLELDFEHYKNFEFANFLNFLINTINLKFFLASEKLKIGKDRKGDVWKIQKHLSNQAKKIEMMVLQSQEKKGISISSSQIRKKIKQGDVNQVAEMMGEYFSLIGNVAKGKQIGQKIGFPTLNISLFSGQILPKDGVYLSRTHINKFHFLGLTFVGKPSVQNTNIRKVENHLLNFNNSSYNYCLRVEFLDFLRKNQKFSNLEDLKSQLTKDKDFAENYFKRYTYLH